jgi:hypothetical protein
VTQAYSNESVTLSENKNKNFYPEIIDYYTRQGKACIFHSASNKTFKAYLIYPKKKGVDIVGEGTVSEITYLYESLDLEEHTVSDFNGIFRFKLAENEDILSDEIEKFVKDETE